MMRDLKEELLSLKGRDFPKWYASLSKLDKVEYQIILEELSSEFKLKD
tara:strand:+ start:4947 stop:5090 length:144 start_codon:yes stop_codon:yes gene_type:complete